MVKIPFIELHVVLSHSESRAAQTLREIELEEPIRYAPNDPVESWLVNLLCLDCSGKAHRITHGTPHPSKCELYHVNRDTLFSYHKVCLDAARHLVVHEADL